MKGIKAVIAIILLVSVVFSGCGKTKFETDTTAGTTIPIPTEPQSTEEATTASPYPEFDFSGIKMGMTIEQVQKRIGQEVKVLDKDGKKYFINPFKGIDCLDKSIQKDVWFVFNKAGGLDEIQYKIEKKDNLIFEDAVIFYYNRFGDYAETHDNVKNTIWKLKDVYLVLSAIDAGKYAVSFFESNTFEKEHQYEYEMYLKITGQNKTTVAK
ncbi:MAG: hypothetical protein RR552_06405 [Oscillospiraceae bacterium]